MQLKEFIVWFRSKIFPNHGQMKNSTPNTA